MPKKKHVIDDAILAQGKVADPCAMVIFGAAGDLTKRLLLPAICNLGSSGLLPESFSIIGYARNDYSDASFQKYIADCVKEFVTPGAPQEYGKELVKRCYYVTGGFDKTDDFKKLKTKIESIEKTLAVTKNLLFYMAIPPAFFGIVPEHLSKVGLTTESSDNWRRVVIEKPFGHDLDSAIKLNADLKACLKERQIFRIDHYLGKETVQNLLAFRFSNGIFEPIWNHQYIDHVQITVAESLGVELRGDYYETSGALRDMIPNHIFQLISLIAMEPPISFGCDSVRDEKAKALSAVVPLSPEDVLTSAIRGQYGPGTIDKKSVIGYREEANVDPKSSIDTYVAMKLKIDNWRWAGTPFYIRTGKRLPTRLTEIAIHFKRPPSIMFRDTQVDALAPNVLVVHIQPEEGISLSFGAKVPGPFMKIGDVNMKFEYKDYFGSRPGTGYETLLYDCMMGDGTLFQRADMVEQGWNVVEPVLDVWSALRPRNFPNYKSGTWGPKEADALLARDGRAWRNIS